MAAQHHSCLLPNTATDSWCPNLVINLLQCIRLCLDITPNYLLTIPMASLFLHIQCDGELLTWVVGVEVSEYQADGMVYMCTVGPGEVSWLGRRGTFNEFRKLMVTNKISHNMPSVILNWSPMHFSKSFFCALSSYWTGTCNSVVGGTTDVSHRLLPAGISSDQGRWPLRCHHSPSYSEDTSFSNLWASRNSPNTAINTTEHSTAVGGVRKMVVLLAPN